MPEDRNLRLLFVTPERFMEDDRHVVDALNLHVATVDLVTSLKRAEFRLTSSPLPLPDALVLTDYDYAWDGVELVKALRANTRTRTLPIVMLSTDCDPQIPDRRPRAMAAGANAFHVVPERIEKVLASVRAAVA
jgi:CheY-like chemotaxis protein